MRAGLLAVSSGIATALTCGLVGQLDPQVLRRYEGDLTASQCRSLLSYGFVIGGRVNDVSRSYARHDLWDTYVTPDVAMFLYTALFGESLRWHEEVHEESLGLLLAIVRHRAAQKHDLPEWIPQWLKMATDAVSADRSTRKAAAAAFAASVDLAIGGRIFDVDRIGDVREASGFALCYRWLRSARLDHDDAQDSKVIAWLWEVLDSDEEAARLYIEATEFLDSVWGEGSGGQIDRRKSPFSARDIICRRSLDLVLNQPGQEDRRMSALHLLAFGPFANSKAAGLLGVGGSPAEASGDDQASEGLYGTSLRACRVLLEDSGQVANALPSEANVALAANASLCFWAALRSHAAAYVEPIGVVVGGRDGGRRVHVARVPRFLSELGTCARACRAWVERTDVSDSLAGRKTDILSRWQLLEELLDECARLAREDGDGEYRR